MFTFGMFVHNLNISRSKYSNDTAWWAVYNQHVYSSFKNIEKQTTLGWTVYLHILLRICVKMLQNNSILFFETSRGQFYLCELLTY